MGYKSKSIKSAVSDIEFSKMYLPALQRKFVWGKHQIELLFDSLMRNYPIGTFLFWNLKSDIANSYVFYEFLKAYDQRNPYNKRKEGVFLHPEIVGILDGQQRLSSMYIGLQGTHTEKRPYMHWSNDRAFEPTKLYLNLLSLPYSIGTGNVIATSEESNFDFLFLNEDDCQKWVSRKVKRLNDAQREVEVEESMYWFRVGEVLTWNSDPEYDVIIDEFIKKCIDDKQRKAVDEKRRFIKKALETLYKRTCEDQLINFFEVNKTDLEDILKIFIRVNSGGTILSKTDLLFSTIVATWDNGREQIEGLLKKINQKGDGFSFGNDYLMRSCLVLSDSPVLFKVNSFKSENVQRIKDNWLKISDAVKKTVDLLVEFGFSGTLLTSQNATIIIAYYILKGGVLNSHTKAEWKKYLVHSLLNGLYGSSQDQVLNTLRVTLRKQEKGDKGKVSYTLKSNTFSFDTFLTADLPSRKSFLITEEEIDNFLTYRKSAGSFFVLTLLYPNLKYQEVQFHQDHIHPASKFNNEVFKDLELTDEEMKTWYERRDTIPNLQLMEGRQNESKNAIPFGNWLREKYLTEQERVHFCNNNLIPMDEKFEFKNFISFYHKRREMIKQGLMGVLAIGKESKTEQINDDGSEDEMTRQEVDFSVSDCQMPA